MNQLRHLSFAFLTFVGWVRCEAQTIVNTETMLLDAETAFQWTAGVSGDFSQGNSNVIDLSMEAGAAWTQGLWTVKGAGAWARLAEDGNDIQANSFGQLRLTVGEVSAIQPYVFVQSSTNNILLLSQRNLIGAGVKRRAIDRDRFFVETSFGAFWEGETYTEESNETPKELVRNGVILSAGWDVSDDVMLRLTTYAQSAYTDFSDTRVFVEGSVDVMLTTSVALEWSAGFRWDGQPHGGLGHWDLGNTVGLRFGLSASE